VHEGPAAQAMGALAFTLGEELHFAPGLYDPESREGVALLGHELTHVVQQRDGRVANPYGQGVAIVQDPALEAEADRMGQRIADEVWSGARIGQPSMERGSGRVLAHGSRSPRFHVMQAAGPGRSMVALGASGFLRQAPRLDVLPGDEPSERRGTLMKHRSVQNPGFKFPRVILASSANWSKVKSKSHTPKMTRDDAWGDDELVGQAQNTLNQWCQYQQSQPKRTKEHGEDLIICLWVYITNKGAIATVEATNENPKQEYRSMTPKKATVCAEDIMCRKYPELMERTLYSIAYNATQRMTWPACSSVNGGCSGLLERLGIVEPPYAGLERDLGGKRIYDH